MDDTWEVLVITPNDRPRLTFTTRFATMDQFFETLQNKIDCDLVNYN